MAGFIYPDKRIAAASQNFKHCWMNMLCKHIFLVDSTKKYIVRKPEK